MTYKELLCSVTFEEVEPHIVSMYPEHKDIIGWFKLHYDMLRLMEPKHHDDSNGDVCKITMEDWEDGTGLHLDAYPMEGDWWEHSLTKEIVLDANVHATNAEIAACCLWHTSFYGFVEGQKMDWLRGDYKPKAMELKKMILRHGGYVPSIRELLPSKRQELIEKAKKDVGYGNKRANRTKRKRLFRHVFMEKYYERMVAIGNFITKVLPALSIEVNYLTISQLCNLFHSGTFASVTIQSYADKTTDASSYLTDLITRYDMLPQADNVIIYLAAGHPWNKPPLVNTNEDLLLTALRDKVITTEEIEGSVDIVFDYKPDLGNQIEITVVAMVISM